MIRITDVTQSYQPNRPVLRGVTLHVPRGSFVAVAGSSGAGKTTLLSVINGMVRPDRGQVLIGGRDLTAAAGKSRRSIQSGVAMIYQDFRLVAESTVLDNTLNGTLAQTPFWRVITGQFSREQRERAMQALEAVGLADKAASLASRLSGGQKQRAAIARALTQGAQVILADEPVASLDPATAEQILSLLKTLQQSRGLTVLLNSHSPREAQAYSDRIVGLKGGQIVRDAASADWTEADFAFLYGSAQ